MALVLNKSIFKDDANPSEVQSLESILFDHVTNADDKLVEFQKKRLTDQHAALNDSESEKYFGSQHEFGRTKEIFKLKKRRTLHSQRFSDSSDSENELTDAKPENIEPAWYDENDAQKYVDIMHYTKLVKLREPTDEITNDKKNVILSGSEFQRRLKRLQETKLGSNIWVNKLRGQSKENLSTQALTQLLQTSIPLTSDKRAFSLPGSKIRYKALTDANKTERSECIVNRCQFLPNADSTIYTTGKDKVLRFFKNVGTKHPKKIKSFHFENSPIAWSEAHEKSSSILGICGKNNVFQLDLATMQEPQSRTMFFSGTSLKLHRLSVSSDANTYGVLSSDGCIFLGDIRTKSIVQYFKMNSFGRCLEMSPNMHIYSGDDEGKIYIWDRRSSKCLFSFNDVGSVSVTSMNLSPDYKQLAVGSKSGYVNFYQLTSSLENIQSNLFELDKMTGIPPLINSSGHLQAVVTCIRYHNSNEIVALTSSFIKEGVKLVHLPTYRAFRNFPKQDMSLNILYPTCIDFNSRGDLMVIGNSHGNIKTFNLPFFNDQINKLKEIN